MRSMKQLGSGEPQSMSLEPSAEGKRELNGLRIDEVGPRGDGNAAHAAGARGKRAQRAWEELHRLAGLDVVRVPRSQLVVQAGDELVLDGLRHLLHHCFTYLCSFRFARLTKGVEGRLRSQRPAVAAGLAADPGPFAAGGHGDGNVVQPEGGLCLRPRTPCRAASDLWQRPIPGLALRLRVDPEDLRPLGPPLLLNEIVIHGSRLLHVVQGLHVRGHARPRGV